VNDVNAPRDEGGKDAGWCFVLCFSTAFRHFVISPHLGTARVDGSPTWHVCGNRIARHTEGEIKRINTVVHGEDVQIDSSCFKTSSVARRV
jgi:hypothetical protein